MSDEKKDFYFGAVKVSYENMLLLEKKIQSGEKYSEVFKLARALELKE